MRKTKGMDEGKPDGSYLGFLETQGEQVHVDTKIYRDAETIEQHLQFIQRAMRYFIEADKRQLPLTPPQVQVLTVLTQPPHVAGLTLKELSKSMGLAHSTVSGIVDRLERQGLLRRTINPNDRRASRIQVTDLVTQYLQQSLPSRRLHPLLTALQQASEAERKTIIDGLATLQQLFTRS